MPNIPTIKMNIKAENITNVNKNAKQQVFGSEAQNLRIKSGRAQRFGSKVGAV